MWYNVKRINIGQIVGIYYMSNKNSWLGEKYITSQVLPKEQILSWIKWDPKVEFDTIIIKSEADVFFRRFLNVDEKIFKEQDVQKGKVVITKNLLQIPNFVGFEAYYNMVPEDERQLLFVIEFIHGNKSIDKVELVTEVIRPKVFIKHLSPAEISVTPEKRWIGSLHFTLENRGKARVTSIAPFIDVVKAKDMQVEIKEITERDTSDSFLFMPTTVRTVSKIIIKGFGYGMLSLGFEYEDALHNKYETKVSDIILDIKQKEKVEVPIASTIEGNQPALVLEPRVV